MKYKLQMLLFQVKMFFFLSSNYLVEEKKERKQNRVNSIDNTFDSIFSSSSSYSYEKNNGPSITPQVICLNWLLIWRERKTKLQFTFQLLSEKKIIIIFFFFFTPAAVTCLLKSNKKKYGKKLCFFSSSTEIHIKR